ncbi:hypothetical protein AX774_g7725 [Zancudomyces culisetae]|uniref:Uncharacterized protein n=1 Tax=Zancudomyces culisetae TaxID=1213189 RepID=A0A1R1PD06_ZANCU|nr:hypothetical protein AX774_g7725 [Zancudomyces culisetae]|eukprot:OMH78875.1 hypothetical protein AX774_g7725 [Zancudomyces culisetae]
MRFSVILSILAAAVVADAAYEKCPARPTVTVTVTTTPTTTSTTTPTTTSTTASTSTSTTTSPTSTSTTTSPTSTSTTSTTSTSTTSTSTTSTTSTSTTSTSSTSSTSTSTSTPPPSPCQSFPKYSSLQQCVTLNGGIYFETEACECECLQDGNVSCIPKLVCNGTPTNTASAYADCQSRHPMGQWISAGPTNSECRCDSAMGCACTALA